MYTDAVELAGSIDAPGPLVITCEHASPALPPELSATAEDHAWLQTHWGWDIGAAEVTRELARLTRSPGVLTRVSRLVCDANRPVDAPTWIRAELEEGDARHSLSFNAGVDPAERARRAARYHAPYHEAIDALVAQRLLAGLPVLLLSIHSFTPLFGAERRTMEVGVLFDEHEPLAERLAQGFAAQGLTTALNEPYSGREGLIYAAHRHGSAHGVVYLELELRHDLLRSTPSCHAMSLKIFQALGALGIGAT